MCAKTRQCLAPTLSVVLNKFSMLVQAIFLKWIQWNERWCAGHNGSLSPTVFPWSVYVMAMALVIPTILSLDCIKMSVLWLRLVRLMAAMTRRNRPWIRFFREQRFRRASWQREGDWRQSLSVPRQHLFPQLFIKEQHGISQRTVFSARFTKTKSFIFIAVSWVTFLNANLFIMGWKYVSIQMSIKFEPKFEKNFNQKSRKAQMTVWSELYRTKLLIITINSGSLYFTSYTGHHLFT